MSTQVKQFWVSTVAGLIPVVLLIAGFLATSGRAVGAHESGNEQLANRVTALEHELPSIKAKQAGDSERLVAIETNMRWVVTRLGGDPDQLANRNH